MSRGMSDQASHTAEQASNIGLGPPARRLFIGQCSRNTRYSSVGPDDPAFCSRHSDILNNH